MNVSWTFKTWSQTPLLLSFLLPVSVNRVTAQEHCDTWACRAAAVLKCLCDSPLLEKAHSDQCRLMPIDHPLVVMIEHHLGASLTWSVVLTGGCQLFNPWFSPVRGVIARRKHQRAERIGKEQTKQRSHWTHSVWVLLVSKQMVLTASRPLKA